MPTLRLPRRRDKSSRPRQDLDVASLPVPRSAVLRPRAIGSRNASDYWDKLPKLSPKKKIVRFAKRLRHFTALQQQTADTQAQSGCINTAEKESKDQVDRDERMIAAPREHSASLDKHTTALERHTAAMKEQTRGSGDI
ncbi:hypothetical protein KCV04_g689, partial [Aureobasidium melanogenum]